MNYLSVQELTKSYGEKVLFKDLSFGIEKGQKAALIARNGSGKTSLLKIIAGKDTADSGEVVFRKDISIGFLSQEPELNDNTSVIDTIFYSTNPSLTAVKNYEEALLLSEEDYEKHQPVLQRAMDEMDRVNGWSYDTKIKQILSRLQITNLTQKIGTLSGGQKKRVALARVLIYDHDLLIMDEPTNHLDVEMIEWLEDYLSKPDLSLLLVTHDRYFLDNICNEIIELEDNKLYHYDGNYSYFLEKKAEREFNETRETEKARNLYRTELEWIRKMPKARGTKSKSRVDAFSEIEEKARCKKKQEELQLNVKMSRIGGKILELKKVYKTYGTRQILKGFDYTFKKGERIGIVGKNGVGKTTFLNILAGLEQPDSGKVNVGESIVFGYYSQSGLKLPEDKRVSEVVKDIAEVITLADGTKVQPSKFLQYFQFPPNMHHTFVSKLSGGEKRRLYLLTILLKNPNFLILDEPTNDLDLLTLSSLEEFLLNFQGCLLIVSHDRYFMNKLSDHLFVFEGDGIVKDFNGTYDEYRMKVEADEKQALKDKKDLKNAPAPVIPVKAEKKKAGFKEKFEYETLEKEIAELEKLKQELEGQLSSGMDDHEKIMKISSKLEKVIQDLDTKTMRWMELSEEYGF